MKLSSLFKRLFYKRVVMKQLIITEEDYGLKLTFHGRVCKIHLEADYPSIKEFIDKQKPNFGLLLDFRDAEPLCHDAATLINIGRAYYFGKSNQRSAVLYKSHAQIDQLMVQMQDIKHINERYLSSLVYGNDIEHKAIQWIKLGLELQ